MALEEYRHYMKKKATYYKIVLRPLAIGEIDSREANFRAIGIDIDKKYKALWTQQYLNMR